MTLHVFSFCLDFVIIVFQSKRWMTEFREIQNCAIISVLEPENEVLQQNKIYFEDRVHKMKDGEISENEGDTEDEEGKSDAGKKVKSKEEHILRYEQLCRGNSSKVHKYFPCSEHATHAKNA